MRTLTNRIIGLVLALAMLAAFVLVPTPMDIKAEAATVTSTKLCDYIQDGATLHCWNWSIANVKANLGLIANMGYSAVQLSPMQELKEGTVNRPYDNWWAVYQPISFNINKSQSHCVGTKEELIDLCNEAHKYNIKVIMDVVFNHTANNGNNQLCPLVDPDFLYDPSCWHDYSQNSSSYMDRYDVTQKCMAGLPDLNTGNQKVQDKALALMKEYVDCGVDGFRFDAAKQIETPEDHYSYASDFWPTVIDGANNYAASTRGIQLHFYGELLENTDQGNGGQGTLPMSAYTKYMSVTESVWSNDVRYKLEAHNASALRKAYFKAANADKLVLWAESHDTVGDGSSLWSNEYNLNKAWALVSSRAYTMALFFPRCLNITDLPLDQDNPNAKPVIQEMGEIVKLGWSSEFTKQVNYFHNHFAGQSEYLTQDTGANLYYNERGNSGVIIVNFNDGGRDINLPVYAMANGTYYDQLTGNQFTVNGGRIYGTMGDSGVAVVYNPTTVSCSHSSHGIDGYCYDCYAYVGHRSGSKCSVCGTASTRTIYFKNTANWSAPYVYGWHDSNSAAVTSGWPGNKMTLVEGNLYKAEIPATATNIIFNNNSGSQTANLVPSANNDTFDYETGYWSTRGQVDLADNYYLFYTTNTGAYNGYDHRFVDNQVSVSFSESSYVWITDSNGVQYMTDGWQGEVTSTTLKSLDNITGTPDKLPVPAGTTVNFTMEPKSDGTITLSYTTGGSTGGNTGSTSTRTIYFDNSSRGWSTVNVYAWDDATGTYTGQWPGTAMTAIGSNIYSYEVPTAATKMIFNNGTTQSADLIIPTDGRNLYTGYGWSIYGSSDPVEIDYYLFGYINGANYGCEEDYANLGQYKFVDGQLTVHFDVDSYVGIKSSTNEWYMTQAYEDSDYGTFYNTSTGASEKMLIPGGTDVLLTLLEHSDGTISLMYTADECVHSYSEEITTAPTCTTEGMKTYTCSKCGDQYYVVLGATGHSYTSKVTTAATCTKEGIKTFTCGTCGNEYTEIIPATGHNYSNGKCTVCGTADSNCSHSYTSKVTIAATCISMGTRTYTCSKCGDVYTEDIAATGHNYVDIVVPPSCEMNGYTKHQCSFCGAWGLNTDPVNPTGHQYDSTGTCTACGQYNANFALKYYLFGWINGKDYACESDWTNMGEYQFVDGKLTVHFDDASYVGIKTTNNEKWYMVKAYTEETSATFYTTDEGGCDKMFIPGNVDVTMTLTENADGTLTLSYVAGNCDHLFSSYVSNQPGCTTEGVRVSTCGYCGYSYNESIPATGHNYINGVCYTCGEADPSYAAPDYYLFGYINGADYGWKDDINNLGYYKFTDGQLTVRFDEASYVAVKTGDNAHFYMTNGYMGESPSAILIEFADPNAVAANRLYVPGGVPITLYLTQNNDGSLLLRYTMPPSACAHVMHGSDGICSACGTLVGHSYSNGVCSICGSMDESYEAYYDYYLFGYINGANYGCEEDYANLGEYLFVDGKLTATFDTYSYIGIKKVNPNAKYGAEVVGWYMTEAYTEASSAIFMNTASGASEKMYVPGGVPVTFTLVNNGDDTLTLRYTTGSGTCTHSYTAKVTTAVGCSNDGVMTYTCSKCGSSYTETIPATGHDFVGGVCTFCGVLDEPTTLKETYYLVGWINGADYGCESDYENNGIYKFVNGQLSAKFTEDSYVFVKTENNGKWLLADAYTETPICTFKQGGTEKLFVPGGVQLIFNITENADGSVVVSYSESAVSGCDHTYVAEVTTAATCTTSGVRTYTCSKCSHRYTQTIAATGHNFFGNTCTVCGIADPNAGTTTGNTYYLVGYINGADYGCEGDYQNMGQYRFVNGRLTATFTQDSYVFVKTEGNGKWLMSGAYCEASTCTFAEGGSEKMFVPGGVQLTFTLAENTDGSVTVVYTSGSTPASVVPTLTLKSPTLEFKDMICINAFYTAENTQDVVEMGMITYTSKVSRWSVRSAEYVIPGATYVESSGRYYSSSQGIHAKYLADTFYLAVYAKLADGSYVYSKLAPYSPVTYANSQLKNSTDAKLKQLAVAMLNYGAQAQLYFGHNTGNLANAALTAEHLALPEAYRADMVTAVPAASSTKQSIFANNQGFASRKPAISFEGAFCINYFFTPNYAPTSGITLYYWNAEDYAANSVLSTSNATGSFKMTGSGTGEYRGDIAGISAKDLSAAVYVAAAYKDSNGTVWTSGVLGYSIGAYCSSQASKGGDIAGLAMATAVYGYHAKAYFG